MCIIYQAMKRNMSSSLYYHCCHSVDIAQELTTSPASGDVVEQEIILYWTLKLLWSFYIGHNFMKIACPPAQYPAWFSCSNVWDYLFTSPLRFSSTHHFHIRLLTRKEGASRGKLISTFAGVFEVGENKHELQQGDSWAVLSQSE